ncbi:MAG: U32 family peptidase [Synechococcales cyanobacterium C42_A2020_086]|jgi:putative protease|nr:U32 family peptidase [Synechococcales cyanobacterium C42_A2020_086]
MTASKPIPTLSLQRPELLAPAGSWDCAKAAIENGADAIYFGLERFNARMRAENFTEADLPELMGLLHQRGVRGYVTLNTLVFPRELAEAEQYLRTIIAAGVDAVIVQDVGLCRLIRHLSPDFPIHASTQMTITSAAGVEFASALGCQLVVLARECSLKEIRKIQRSARSLSLPLEVFVHGALCVAYSGQCLTSEALGGRSANRGECAQACRMPYDLLADGEVVDLGDRKYLLSPQDLAGIDVLPELIQAGVHCLKIEGRLKSAEYVANVTRVYRQALDRAMAALAGSGDAYHVREADRYQLEMAFSRGLYTGWFKGIQNQELVHARFGKKRGVYLGEVSRVGKDYVALRLQAPIKPGDGVVFDNSHPDRAEAGGRVYAVEPQTRDTILRFGRHDVNLGRIRIGDKLWKTSDPELDRQLRQSFAGNTPQFQRPIRIEIYGAAGEPLTAIARDEQGHLAQAQSSMPLVTAHNQPLTQERLKEQFGRLGNTPFRLGHLDNYLQGDLLLPISELNRLRRELVTQLEAQRRQPKRWQLSASASWTDLLPVPPASVPASAAQLVVLVRTWEQLNAVLDAGITRIYAEFEDPRRYRDAVALVHGYRGSTAPQIYVAPPRITKPGEQWILQQVRAANADGYLVRNYDHLTYFAGERCVGDFSLNVANPLTAAYFKQFGLERLTASYDLNVQQLQDLLQYCPPDWLEITIHQHMPMFHMEHCVFCAFLSDGTDYTNCGRPCEQHQVKLRDRVGSEHIVQADAGCRNTVFNGVAQTGAEYVQRLMELGARQFRIEFVNETPARVQHTLERYGQLLQGAISGAQLWRELRLQNQLGVTRGTLM